MESNNRTTTISQTAAAADGRPVSQDSGVRYYSRFSAPQRFLHGFLAVTFLGLAMTGLTLRFSSAHWATALASAVGGFGTVLFFHLFSAVVLTVAFLIHVANLVYRLIARREFGLVWGPTSMVPNLKDIQDFIAQAKWFFFRGPKPKFGRYAYWDKVDYWAVFWGMAIIGLSGYAMWFAPFFAKFIPGSWLNIALLIHGEEAILAVGFIFTIHFFNTHLRPGCFPMDLVIFTGRLTEEEMQHKHPEEYRRLVESGELEKLRVEPPPQWLKNFGWTFGTVAIAIGFVFLSLMVVAFVKE
ncbi:MAG TPA: cytochrome b/b6 domain-containing protein [Bryobacteraceae bacterium]|nr:cytochrome b/b6 domain-containing protein [Bryobacteraceae bacterium]